MYTDQQPLEVRLHMPLKISRSDLPLSPPPPCTLLITGKLVERENPLPRQISLNTSRFSSPLVTPCHQKLHLPLVFASHPRPTLSRNLALPRSKRISDKKYGLLCVFPCRQATKIFNYPRFGASGSTRKQSQPSDHP